MLCLLIACLLAILCLLDGAIRFSKKGRLLNRIHGPKGIPVFGNIFQLLDDPVVLFTIARQWAKRYKRFHRIWIAARAVLVIYDPDDVEVLLTSTKHINKSTIYGFLKPWLGDGLLLTKGVKWHQRRKMLTPAFHFNILREFCNIFNEQSSILVSKIKNETNGEAVDLKPYITQYALKAILETAMGSSRKRDDAAEASYKNAIYCLGENVLYRLVRLWLHVPFIFNATSVGKKQTKLLSTLHSFTTDVIRERRRLREGETIKMNDIINSDDSFYNTNKKHRPAMLDLLLDAESEGKIDELGIREEVDTFMFEGHDTTSAALMYTLMVLANNQDIQKKVFDEMIEIFGDSDRQPTMSDMQNMKYLDCCLKEALRLYPSVPIISRYISEEMQLRNYTVPANAVVHLYIYDLHRNTDIFPEPEKFDPDRFLPENSINRHPFAYIPFSAGLRNCIGQKFAVLEEKSIISAIIRNFVLEPVTIPSDLIFKADLILRTDCPVFVKFIQR